MHQFDPCEDLDFSDEPSIPVSRLYRILPPGLDTIDVIALTDYIILEANEYFVPIHALVEREIYPLINSTLRESERPMSARLSAHPKDISGINGATNSPKWI